MYVPFTENDLISRSAGQVTVDHRDLNDADTLKLWKVDEQASIARTTAPEVGQRRQLTYGLDDGVFPRGARIDGDDILARDPAIGERDPRGEDRQLMLDALLAATEHLVITYTGADERTGAPRPPAVPLGELLDALDDTAHTSAGGPARDQVLIRQPLQPFDARNVTPGALGTAWALWLRARRPATYAGIARGGELS